MPRSRPSKLHDPVGYDEEVKTEENTNWFVGALIVILVIVFVLHSCEG